MKNVLHVLSVEPANSCSTTRDALLKRGCSRLSVVMSYDDLFAISKLERFEIAILHQLPSLRDFRASGQYIRRTWPNAKILVICTNAEVLDDPLYDDRLAPGHSPDVLLAAIQRLTTCSAEARKRALGL